MRIFFLLLLFVCHNAFGDVKIIIGGFSNHIQPMKPAREIITPIRVIVYKNKQYRVGGYSYIDAVEFNEKHPAIGIEYHGLEITAYENSVNEISYSLSRIIERNGYGARIGLAKYTDIIPVVQFGYFSDNYDLTFGMVSAITFKVNV